MNGCYVYLNFEEGNYSKYKTGFSKDVSKRRKALEGQGTEGIYSLLCFDAIKDREDEDVMNFIVNEYKKRGLPSPQMKNKRTGRMTEWCLFKSGMRSVINLVKRYISQSKSPQREIRFNPLNDAIVKDMISEYNVFDNIASISKPSCGVTKKYKFCYNEEITCTHENNKWNYLGNVYNSIDDVTSFILGRPLGMRSAESFWHEV